MACYIGIHVGNSSACVAVGKKGKIGVVANSHGDRLTPSMVTFTDEEILVGFSSKQVSHRYISGTIKHFNQVINKSCIKDDGDMNHDHMPSCRASLETLPDGSFAYSIKQNGKVKSFKPEKILELLLSNLLETALSQAGSDAKEVVLTAPVGSSTTYCNAVRSAATNAGFDVLRVISEPAAACLAYGIAAEKSCATSQRVLVFRVGGISQDVTILGLTDGIMSVEKHVRVKSGGDVLTDVIANHFASLFKKQFRVDITSNVKSMNKLKINAENCKHILSSMPSSNCHIDSLYDGMDFSCNLSRSMFEMIANEHLQNLVNPLRDVASSHDTDKMTINKVILSGGTCSIPKLQNLVANIFPDAEILTSIPASEVTAVGAAYEAGLLANQDLYEVSQEDCFLSLAPVDIYLKFVDQVDVVVKQKTVLPFNTEKQYTCPSDKSEAVVQLCICDPNSRDAYVVLGSISVALGDGENELTCMVKYNSNGNITVSCDNATSSRSFTVTASS